MILILLLPLTARAQTAPPAGVPPLSTLLAGSIYEPWGALAGAAFGNGAAGGTETLAYGSRDRLSSLTTTGADASATGSTNLSGSEQVKKGAAPTQASGAVKIYGDEQSVQVAAQAGTGSVGIGGAEFEFQMCGPPGRYSGVLKPACREVWASGTVSITVQGQAFSAGYGQGSTSASLAAALAAAVNSGSRYATAVAAGGEVHLTARTTRSATDYSLSAAATSSDSSERAAFSAAASGAAFTGGRSASTYYDAGTVEITINGQEITASFGQGSTSASVAAALASAVNSGSSYATASASGRAIYLSARPAFAGTDYSLRFGTPAWDSAQFGSPSFFVTSSETTLLENYDASPVTGIPATRTARITILLLNGKNGRPMRHHIVNVYVYRRMPPNYSPESGWTLWNEPLSSMIVRTNRDGEFTFPVPAHGAVREITGGFSVSCLPPLPNKTPAGNILYPVSRILSHGVVTENTCGKGRAVPKPGVLVIFARPMTLWERLRT